MSNPLHPLRSLFIAGLLPTLLGAPAPAAGLEAPATQTPATETPVTEAVGIRFSNPFWLNLHHTLYASAYEGRTRMARPPASLSEALTGDDLQSWRAAVEFYRAGPARLDLRTGEGMPALRDELAASAETLGPAVDGEMRAHLLAVAPIYRDRMWPEHQAANAAWIADISRRLNQVAPEVIVQLERVLETPWLSSPAVMHVVRYGRAYTTDDPVVTVMATDDQAYQGWMGAEMSIHEAGHALTRPLRTRLACEGGARGIRLGELWHATLFYLVGESWRSALERRGERYTPYAYDQGLLTGLWGRYRTPLENEMGPFLAGERDAGHAYAALVSAAHPNSTRSGPACPAPAP